jgi:hypothetical protein
MIFHKLKNLLKTLLFYINFVLTKGKAGKGLVFSRNNMNNEANYRPR